MHEKPTWPPSLSGNHIRETLPHVAAMVGSPDVSALIKSSCITLREITKDTVRAVSLLDVGPGQVGLVAPNAYSIAQTTFHREAWIRAVCADDVAVGFAMMKD